MIFGCLRCETAARITDTQHLFPWKIHFPAKFTVFIVIQWSCIQQGTFMQFVFWARDQFRIIQYTCNKQEISCNKVLFTSEEKVRQLPRLIHALQKYRWKPKPKLEAFTNTEQDIFWSVQNKPVIPVSNLSSHNFSKYQI